MFKWVFWRCLQAVITLWGCERKYRLGWYLVDLPALPPARSGGGGGGLYGRVTCGSSGGWRLAAAAGRLYASHRLACSFLVWHPLLSP